MDEFQDLTKTHDSFFFYSYKYIYIYIYTVEQKDIFTPFLDGNDREMNLK